MKFAALSLPLLMLVQASVVFSLVAGINAGKDATPGQFPYQVSIQWGLPPFVSLVHSCGGSIIKSNWILTAGHCITSTPSFGKLVVKAGLHDISVSDEFVQTLHVEKIELHEDYPGGISPNDIALILLKTNIIFKERVAPVDLPTPGFARTGDAVLSGWGAHCKRCYQKSKCILQTTTLPVVTNEECQRAIRNINDSGFVYENQLCTISQDESNTCPGDSGGPLVQNVNGKTVQVGIISWDVLPCGSANAPTVYTRVSSFIDWIDVKTRVQ